MCDEWYHNITLQLLYAANYDDDALTVLSGFGDDLDEQALAVMDMIHDADERRIGVREAGWTAARTLVEMYSWAVDIADSGAVWATI